MNFDFPTNLSIESCEGFLSQLESADSVEDILMPEGTKNIAFGSYAAAIQAINTWARRSSSRNVYVKATGAKTSDRVDELLSRPHKFCLSMLAKNIYVDGDLEDIRPLVNGSAREVIEQQGRTKFGQRRGGLCWFALVDHSTKGFDRNFYLHSHDKKPIVRGQLQFKSVMSAMVGKSTDLVGGAEPLSEEESDYLGRIFYELFLNTHEHGSRSFERDTWLKPGIRVIYTNGINLSASSVDARASANKAMEKYFSAIDELPLQRRRFIEISVVDSGLGYEGRWRADQPQIESDSGISRLDAEYEIFKKCFTFRQTSSGKSSKGHGLPVVMERLTRLKAFMRVRSGRLSLFRDFINNPFKNDDPCDFEDWETQERGARTEMAPVSGVAVTFLIPLELSE
ncbi:hypothetical protein ACEPXJ_18350 [Pseudomonas aeruginosa]|uniref:hypothetical protein n=1 Tax=Pseudomonas aeruginosa TaxID=287 RepID=UPI000FF4CA3E|nr:hypothetical protein [Pseudomonas aeruginosa]RWX98993.1 hypothetical protein EQH71_22395 [Pseudomonas aeruginosa]HBN8248695.1 hypothetical protein [Pseudomonas aeruginosa]HEB0640351.1 hypothetical protein [Pseudomonas aeruginosa]HEB0652141.1 hypothetical protein [Pseudomonas aeruginosa]